MKTIIFAIVLFSISGLANANVVIIANKNLNVEVSKVRLKQLFTLRKNTFKGADEKVKLFLTDNPNNHKFFSEEFIGMSPKRLSKRYSKVSFSGEGEIPSTLSEQQIIDEVSRSPNALGVIKSELVTDSVKVLHTIN